jgi:type IV pilus assembly protein PilB
LGLYEVMHVTEEVERLTVERAASDRIREVALEQGMMPLRLDGLNKARQGLTSVEEILRVVV